MTGEYRFGIEEEYFVNDAVKRDAARARMPDFLRRARAVIPDHISLEMLESLIPAWKAEGFSLLALPQEH